MGIKPVEAIKEILKIVFIFMAFLAILIRSCFSPKKSQEANHNIFIYEPLPNVGRVKIVKCLTEEKHRRDRSVIKLEGNYLRSYKSNKCLKSHKVDE